MLQACGPENGKDHGNGRPVVASEGECYSFWSAETLTRQGRGRIISPRLMSDMATFRGLFYSDIMTFPATKCNHELSSSVETGNCGSNGQDGSSLPPYPITA